jgi:hypothetical protein
VSLEEQTSKADDINPEFFVQFSLGSARKILSSEKLSTREFPEFTMALVAWSLAEEEISISADDCRKDGDCVCCHSDLGVGAVQGNALVLSVI